MLAETLLLPKLYQHLNNALSRLLINSGLALNIVFEYAISFTYIINSVFILLNICFVAILLKFVFLIIHFSITTCHVNHFWAMWILAFALFYYPPMYTVIFFIVICSLLFNRHLFAFAATYFTIIPGACTTITKSWVSVPMASESKVPFVSYIVVSEPNESEPQSQPPEELKYSHLRKHSSKITDKSNADLSNDSTSHVPFNKMDFSPLATTELNLDWDLENVQVYSAQEINTEVEEEIEAILVPDNFGTREEDMAYSFTAYKRVDKKVKPVSTTFPEEARVRRQIPEDPLKSLTPLSKRPPDFVPTSHITQELYLPVSVRIFCIILFLITISDLVILYYFNYYF
jgi:hypothetical protein